MNRYYYNLVHRLMRNCIFKQNIVAFLVFCCILAGVGQLANAQLIKGPYLIYSGFNTQMEVLWQTDGSQESKIFWGTDKSCSSADAVSFEYAKDHQHKFTIKGLMPGSKYYYRISEGSNIYTGSFRAAPPSNASSVSFLAYGDTRSNPDRQDQVCRNIISTLEQNPTYQTFILHVGDWASSNSEKDWARDFFNRSYKNNIAVQANLPIEGCRGNHETRGFGNAFEEFWPYPYMNGGLYWSFDYGPAHVAIVDVYTNFHQGSAQYRWLEQDLKNSPKKWKFLVFHEPGWSAYAGFRGNNKDVQANIQPLCQKYGVQIVFCGHYHCYARAEVNGVQHLTLGTGGAPFHKPKSGQPNIVAYDSDILGFARINISGNTLHYEMIRTPDNAVIDSFTIMRN